MSIINDVGTCTSQVPTDLHHATRLEDHIANYCETILEELVKLRTNKTFERNNSYQEKLSLLNYSCKQCKGDKTQTPQVRKSTLDKLQQKVDVLKHHCKIFDQGIASGQLSVDQFSLDEENIVEAEKPIQLANSSTLWNAIRYRSIVVCACNQYVRLMDEKQAFESSFSGESLEGGFYEWQRYENDLKKFTLICAGIMSNKNSKLMKMIRTTYSSDLLVNSAEKDIKELKMIWQEIQSEDYVVQACHQDIELQLQQASINCDVDLLQQQCEASSETASLLKQKMENRFYEFVLQCAGFTSNIDSEFLNAIRC